MDGIPVKISEKYKPPRKITLPASVQNKLKTGIKFDKYDFGLERFVAEKMALLREKQVKSPEIITKSESSINISPEESFTHSNNILTPVPILKSHRPTAVTNQQVIGGINISDFENDTSSPFDSVELKTLNDMEELAHVLGGTQITGRENWYNNENGSQNWGWGANYSHPQTYSPQPLHHAKDDIVPKVSKREDNETSEILKVIQQRIHERQAVLAQPKRPTENSGLSIAAGISSSEKLIERKREVLPNPLSSLNGQSQAVARRIAEMGFPIARAARATEMFGPNEGKVIEFMLEVQSLEESGYPGERAERALVFCSYSVDEAVKFLDNMEQIMRLGFGEEEVISALVKSGFNRDKALDSLIS